jgi:chloride channel protein, CIC family
VAADANARGHGHGHGHGADDGRERIDGAALPVAPSMAPALAAEHVRPGGGPRLVDRRVLWICALCMALACAAALVAQLLTRLIALVTNLAYYGRLSIAPVSPGDHHLGWWSIAIPVAGGVVVGLMARYGSRAIRGHGIPEAMEQVLTNQSRIPPRLTFLKPLSAAIAIGTGGPFGAEGPIIATGGALGSLIGQLLRATAAERKTMLAAGAAAGMAATFGSPLSAVLLAVELLLFEYRPRSLIPVALAAATAAGVRVAFVGGAPVFPMFNLAQPSGAALATYIGLGALVGVASVLVTRWVYAVEDGFEKLKRIHWMWWPALGGIVVGVVGVVAPRTLGVGYDNIEHIVGGDLAGRALVFLCAMKLISWSVALGSGTSGGTLAPLFTIGGGLGAALGAIVVAIAPSAGVDVRIAALVGMAAIFAGASRALLASVVFAFETTRQPLGLLPLLGGCTAAFLISCVLLENSIMTEKIARRGVRVPAEYEADRMEHVHVHEVALRVVVTVAAGDTVAQAHARLAAAPPHQAFPVVDGGELVGVVTRRARAAATADARVRSLVKRAAVVVYDDCTMREAADLMFREGVGRLPVVKRGAPRAVIGIVTRSDLLTAAGHATGARVAARTTAT